MREIQITPFAPRMYKILRADHARRWSATRAQVPRDAVGIAAFDRHGRCAGRERLTRASLRA
jgi:hypothetical protein